MITQYTYFRMYFNHPGNKRSDRKSDLKIALLLSRCLGRNRQTSFVFEKFSKIFHIQAEET